MVKLGNPRGIGPDLIKCPGCDKMLPENNARAQVQHMEVRHPDIINNRLRENRMPTPEAFSREMTDEELAKYENPLDFLHDMYIPGNYAPTKEQTKQLIICAARSIVRWYELYGVKV